MTFTQSTRILACSISGAAIALVLGAGTSIAQTSWVRQITVDSPQTTAGAMAFDQARGVCVFYGDRSGSTNAWEYDGGNWVEVVTAINPGPRFDHAMAYDSSRGVVVLYGGVDASGIPLSDTWEYDGTDWVNVDTPIAPDLRNGPSMAYDSNLQRCVLFGTTITTTISNETWTYSGATGTWTQVATPASPTGQDWTYMAYDSWNQQTLVFGGASASAVTSGELWAFDASTGSWTELNSIAGPGPRVRGCAVFDEMRGALVIYGGINASISFQDTWEYDVSTGYWAEHLDSQGHTFPIAVMAYDSVRATTVAYGRFHRTWEFGGGSSVTSFCFGDGSSGALCPCGNSAPSGSGEGCLNSQDYGATISLGGSRVVAADDAFVQIDNARPGQPGMLIQGYARQLTPFFDGIFCMGNPTERIEIVFLDSSGSGSTSSSIVQGGSVSAGSVRHYQFWYRDPALSPCGTGSNFSNGMSVFWE